METKVIKTSATLQFVHRETIACEFQVNLGEIERPSQVEKLRKSIQENNPEYIVLVDFKQEINPSYSPLTLGL
nr:MAG TPA: hypothetical protein [Bacteriophage sp.]